MNLPMINSTNSVSTSKRKREAERSVNWTVEETQVLLCAWSDERIQKSLAENLRNRHVFKLLSVRMCELGFARSPHQCRLRVKTLKANYVRAKLQRSAGGGQQPCSFKYFAEMDAVLGRRASDGGRHLGSNGMAGEDRGRHLGSNGMADGGRHLGSNGVAGEDRGRHLGSNNLGTDGGRHLGSSDMTVDGGRHLVSKATGADRGRHLGSKFFATAALSLRTAGLRPGADTGGARFAAFLEGNDDNGGQLVPLIASAVAGTESVEPPAWQPEAEVKMEDLENSTDEYEYECGDTSFLQTGVYHNPDGTLSELHHRAPSPLALPQMPPPMPPPPAPSPLPPPTMDPPTTTNNNNNIGSSSSRTTPHSSSSSSSSAPPPRPEGPGACAGAGAGPGGPGSLAGAEPALGHLSQCFQRLVEETRGLLVQLEAERQKQAQGHQELLARWLEWEERRQREAADREERRERARMAHEIRVLELLGGLARQGAGAGPRVAPGPGEGRCRCGGMGAGVGEGPGEAATDSLHHSSKEER